MTALMCQVTCGLCHDKVNERMWKEHLTSEKHLQLCESTNHTIATKFFEMNFEARPEKKNIFTLKNEKSLNSWRSYF